MPHEQTSSSPTIEHKFNDDILLTAPDREFAKSRYETIYHILDHPELRELFERYDVPANRAKQYSKYYGLIAVISGTLALLGASSEPLLHYLPPVASRVVGLACAAMGVLCVILGPVALLRGAEKRRWLYSRIMTERLRLFHFQTFVRHWNTISSKALSVDEFFENRKLWFSHFCSKHVGKLDSIYSEIVDNLPSSSAWLHDNSSSDGNAEPDPTVADALFSAYRLLRFERQIEYANHMLRPDHHPVSMAPKFLNALFSNVAIICITLLLIIHLIISGFLIGGFTASTLLTIAHVAAIWTAIVALAFRALEEGLQPDREIEHYYAYRARVISLKDRFDSAKANGGKLDAMREMELLAHEELSDFVRHAHSQRFFI